MPALPNVAKCIKLAMVYSDGVNLDIVTRMHLLYSGSAPSNADLDTFCQTVFTAETGDLNPLRSGEVYLIRADATDL